MSKKSPVYEFGNFRFEPGAVRLIRLEDGREIDCHLRPMARALLRELLNAWPDVLRFEQAGKLVWGEEYDPDDEHFRNRLRATVADITAIMGLGSVQTVRKEGYRFGLQFQVKSAEDRHPRPLPVPKLNPEPLGPPVGALPIGSKVYVSRSADDDLRRWIEARCSFVKIQAPRQTGKTSILVRGKQFAHDLNARVAYTDCQDIPEDAFSTTESFLRALAQSLSRELDVATPDEIWKSLDDPHQKFRNYLKDEALGSFEEPVVWLWDEVDRLASRDYRDQVFGLLRALHNARAMRPEEHWDRLTVVMTYMTEPSLVTRDPSQSPFNVAMRLSLEDFSVEQVTELNGRYGSLLNNKELDRFYGLVGGHPFLVNYGLYWMAEQKCDLTSFEKQADRDNGPYGQHLQQMWKLADGNLAPAVTRVLQGQPSLTKADFDRLVREGLLTGDAPRRARLRNRLYEHYLKARLL
jgi:DNA-binding winged helix-turn-helix (wHTH) protein